MGGSELAALSTEELRALAEVAGNNGVEVLLELGQRLVAEGDLVGAQGHVDNAARIHERAGRSDERSSCLCRAASLSRLSGNYDGGRLRAGTAEEITRRPLLKSEAACELGEIAVAQGRYREASDHFGRAFQLATDGRASPEHCAGLELLCARALAEAGYPDAACERWQSAAALFEAAGNAIGVNGALVEQTAGLYAAGFVDRAAALAARALARAERTEDYASLAELALMRASRHLATGDSLAAREELKGARQHALCAGAAMSYAAACYGLADLWHQAGQRHDAYRTLAEAWLTLQDAIGSDGAENTVGPYLARLREAWGREEFERIRSDVWSAGQ